MEKEIWIETYISKEYEVSNLGRVKSRDRRDSMGRLWKGKLKKLTINNKGYLRTNITINGIARNYSIHQLVYYSFQGGKPSGYNYVIDHLDSNPLNNRLDNLELVTPHENIRRGNLDKYNLPMYVSAQPYHYDRSKLSYKYQPVINGKSVTLKRSLDLEVVLAFKEEFESVTK